MVEIPIVSIVGSVLFLLTNIISIGIGYAVGGRTIARVHKACVDNHTYCYRCDYLLENGYDDDDNERPKPA